MKKILYYLSNIILGIYLILIIPISNALLRIDDDTWIINEIKWNITWFVLAISCILKVLFRSKKFELKRLEKIISIILFVIEILLIFYMSLMTELL